MLSREAKVLARAVLRRSPEAPARRRALWRSHGYVRDEAAALRAAITWLHLTDADVSRARRVIEAFREEDTVDVLGFQPISEAFDDWFYPAVTTPMTRGRYYIFVPAIYRHLERQRLDLQAFRREAADLQHELQRALSSVEAAGGGVIGHRAEDGIRRLPSAIYWRSLARLGIFRAGTGAGEWSEARYQLEATARSESSTVESDEGPESDYETRRYWDADLPMTGVFRRAGLVKRPSLRLTSEEAKYLQGRFLEMPCGAESLLGVRLRRRIAGPHDHAWSALGEQGIPDALQGKLRHARAFSAAARILSLIYYALVLEEQRRRKVARHGAADDETKLKEEVAYWWRHGRRFVARGWRVHEFQTLVGPAVCTPFDRDCFETVVRLAQSHQRPDDLFRDVTLREAAREREGRKRRTKCRLCGRPQHEKYLKQWGGPPARWQTPFQLSFRHHRGDTIVRDLLQQPFRRRGDVQD
jgi:hypothetical protein